MQDSCHESAVGGECLMTGADGTQDGERAKKSALL